MRLFPVLVIAMLMGACQAAERIQEDNVLFGSVADDDCDESSFRSESGAVATWATKFVANAVVGFGSSLIEKATAETTVVRHAKAPSYFYIRDSDNNTWIPGNGCVRFWLARQRSSPLKSGEVDFGAPTHSSDVMWKGVTSRWEKLGFTEQPFLYGEVRFTTLGSDNLMVIQPVVLFARRPPEATGFFRKAIRLAVTLDIKEHGAESNLATHLIELPDVSDGPILIQGENSTKGLASGWISLPSPPKAVAGDDGPLESVPYTALVTFASTSDGTLFGKVVANTFKSQEAELVTAVTPQSKSQKAAEREKAITDAFDAVRDVLRAQTEWNKASEDARAELGLEVHKAMYLANLRLLAAGLPPRFPVDGP